MERSNNIVDRIKKDNIKPIAKWRFVFKNTLVWLVFGFFVFIGAAAFSVILFSVQQSDFNLVTHLSHSKIELVLALLPFFWIITLFIFLVGAVLMISNSKKGYKLALSSLIGVSTAMSILLGTLFFIAGGARWLEQTFAINVSIYESIQEKKKKIWTNPEEGYLSGDIQKISKEQIEIVDYNNHTWKIDYSDAFIPPVVLLEKGESIKLIGQISSDHVFHAEEIRPWGGMNRMNKNNGRKKLKRPKN